MMRVKFSTPVTVGGIGNQISVEHLEICSVSWNFEPERSNNGKAILSVVLVHPASGWKHCAVWEDKNALQDFQELDKIAGIHKRLLTKLLQDGKVPKGAIEE